MTLRYFHMSPLSLPHAVKPRGSSRAIEVMLLMDFLCRVYVCALWPRARSSSSWEHTCSQFEWFERRLREPVVFANSSYTHSQTQRFFNACLRSVFKNWEEKVSIWLEVLEIQKDIQKGSNGKFQDSGIKGEEENQSPGGVFHSHVELCLTWHYLVRPQRQKTEHDAREVLRWDTSRPLPWKWEPLRMKGKASSSTGAQTVTKEFYPGELWQRQLGNLSLLSAAC